MVLTVSFSMFPVIVQAGIAVITFIDQQFSDQLSEYNTGYNGDHH